MKTYDFSRIEQTWQAYWETHKTFRAANPGEPGFDASRPKFYILDMFPYPSGVGLHVGHPLGYIATDVYARFKRHRGFNVLHPMGFDAFGLPAEQFAIETGTHPEVTTLKNIENMRRQLKLCGLSYDWDREFATTEPDYYRWTQWIFLKLFHSYMDERVGKARPISELIARARAGEFKQLQKPFDDLTASEQEAFLGEYRLAYLAEVNVNWCPGLGTVLANEEVTAEGRSERGNFPVYARPLKQWMLRITAYAERLIADLDQVDWPEAVKAMQRNWVGKSVGAEIHFDLDGFEERLTVFTTRPDTLFGVTFMVLAPQHPLVSRITHPLQKTAIEAFVSRMKNPVSGVSDQAQKEGVFTGAYAIHPLTGDKIPIWVADYVLMGYGTGAIMAVPGHDARDYAFAKAYQIPVQKVVEPLSAQGNDDQVFEGEGRAVHSACAALSINGQETKQAKDSVIAYLEAHQKGRARVQYKLRDWLFSRQRYWGEPFPILHGPNGELRSLDESELPLVLPPVDDFKPRQAGEAQEPEPSLARSDVSWKRVVRDGQTYQRELNTMPNWAGSCWYYLRFLSPQDARHFVEPSAEAYWMGEQGVDLYVGGVEHAVLHLLYARFWHKVLYDLGYVTGPEPFGKLFNQGYIQAYSYQDSRGMYKEATKVVESAPGVFEYVDGEHRETVTRHLGKMGKSLKNAISPDEVIAQYGCDTFRLYEMYLGPIEQSKVWDTQAIVGVHRFLQKLWRNCVDEATGDLKLSSAAASTTYLQKHHAAIAAITQDMETLGFNTAIAQLIILNHAISDEGPLPRACLEDVVILLSPFAPHAAEELWKKLGHSTSVSQAPWPKADPAYLVKDEVEVVIQVGGKRRGSVKVSPKASQEDVLTKAKAEPTVAKYLEGQSITKVVYVPGRLLNVVLGKGV